MDFHPLIIHFPIALLIVGTLCDAIGILGKRDFFLRTGFLLFALGAFTCILAALTGDHVADTAQHISGIYDDLDWHDTLGTATALIAVLLTLTRAHLTFKKRFTGTVQYIYLFIGIAVAILVGASGYTGGRLVYDYGAGTQPIIKTLKIQSDAPTRVPRNDTFQSQ
ncbi:MAG: DUF2231 domain-containing protein [Candidatus Latescibacteria bacterium]|nr:DUF2231 domain-containing protein [Candidatus Latescibacterota bacterium]MBT4136586.1 DUF2231 domain-containing protein [Candidatus Latescibacterota bacterium]MBT5832943.1 DUF2231 domain-containing protein [Candidatus Latescibacterota bacterium]